MLSKSGNYSAYSDSETWTKTNKYRISDTTNFYELENKKYILNLKVKGLGVFGKHYMITYNGKSRNYTNCVSLSRCNQLYRQSLIKDYQKQILNIGAGVLQTEYDKTCITGQFLPLVIKTYNKKPQLLNCNQKALSANLDQCEIGSKVIVDGPMGRGLGLNSQTKGEIVLICAGTGF